MGLSDTNSRVRNKKPKSIIGSILNDDTEPVISNIPAKEPTKEPEQPEKVEETTPEVKEESQNTEPEQEVAEVKQPTTQKQVVVKPVVTHDNFKVNKKGGEKRYTIEKTSIFNQVKLTSSTIAMRNDLKVILDDLSTDSKGTNKRGVKSTILNNALIREYYEMGLIDKEEFESEYKPIPKA